MHETGEWSSLPQRNRFGFLGRTSPTPTLPITSKAPTPTDQLPIPTIALPPSVITNDKKTLQAIASRYCKSIESPQINARIEPWRVSAPVSCSAVTTKPFQSSPAMVGINKLILLQYIGNFDIVDSLWIL